jgi:DNA (cytosine-5)-methyltransferase 1
MNAVDLFAGGGGLTVGLKGAEFNVIGAVENNPSAMATYRRNHPEVRSLLMDITDFGRKDADWLGTGRVDLLAGCPPCQGFTSLTSKLRREDPRNELVLQFSRIAASIRPGAIMMENVPGLARRGKPLLDHLVRDLQRIGYIVNTDVLQVADFGLPQFRRRLVLLAGLGFKIDMPSPTHSSHGKNGLAPWRTLGDAIFGLSVPLTLKESIRSGGPRSHNWHVVRDMTELNRERLAHIPPGGNRTNIPVSLRPPCHQESNKGFTNVYGRMSWEQTPVTITSGCTTLSKGRFGHPEQLRTISVREAALIQTFPPKYEFATDRIDEACSIIGNALPCDFAEIVSTQCRTALVKAFH